MSKQVTDVVRHFLLSPEMAFILIAFIDFLKNSIVYAIVSVFIIVLFFGAIRGVKDGTLIVMLRERAVDLLIGEVFLLFIFIGLNLFVFQFPLFLVFVYGLMKSYFIYACIQAYKYDKIMKQLEKGGQNE